MSDIALVVMLITVMALVALWRLRALSPNLVLILVMLFLTGNTELLLTLFDGELPESLAFIVMDVGDLAYATLLFDLGLLAVAGGMWSFHAHSKEAPRQVTNVASVFPLSSVCVGVGAVRIYALLFVFTAVIKVLMWGPLSPLAQLLVPLLMLRFFPIYVLAYRYFREGRDGAILLGVCVFEIIANLSFFASFAQLFIVVAAALVLAVRDGARFRWLPTVAAAFSMVLVVSAWSYVKVEFREYLSGGERAQIDTRSLPDKLDFLQGQLADIGLYELREGFYTSVLRVAYNGFFAATTSYVPRHFDHTGGSYLIDSAMAVVTPRFLFPKKPIFDDSETVRMYTGLTVAGGDEATSFNIGQFGELYADLGIFGMLVALAVWGGGLAAFDRMILRRLGPGLDASGWSAVFVVVYGVTIFSLPKLIAALVYSSLSAYFLLRFVYPAILRHIPPYWVHMRRVRRT